MNNIGGLRAPKERLRAGRLRKAKRLVTKQTHHSINKSSKRLAKRSFAFTNQFCCVLISFTAASARGQGQERISPEQKAACDAKITPQGNNMKASAIPCYVPVINTIQMLISPVKCFLTFFLLFLTFFLWPEDLPVPVPSRLLCI